MWLKWSFAPAPFTANYVLGFIVISVMVMTIIVWIINRCHGWQNTIQSYWHMAFLIFTLLITGWSIISQYWAFGIEQYPGMAQSSVLQLLIVSIFALVIISTSPSPKIILSILIFSMMFQGAIGGLQVLFQQNIGLDWLGEFTLNVQQSGVSVLEDNGTRWLRPYGLLPHPNILGGVIVLGLFASASYIVQSKKMYLLSSIAFIVGFWFLLLTFSRGAWIGFFVGAVFLLPYAIRQNHFWKKVPPVFLAIIVTGLIFISIFYPLLLSRAGLNEQNTEMRSISDRVVYMEIALDAIQNHPVRGVGMGNFPWYASNYIFFNTNYDLDGNNVHNIYLTVFSELGVVGFGLFMGMLFSGIGAVFRKKSLERLVLLAGFIAWAVMGIFDHFMWTLVITQLLWLGILAVAMSGTEDNTQPSPLEA